MIQQYNEAARSCKIQFLLGWTQALYHIVEELFFWVAGTAGENGSISAIKLN